MTDDIIKAVKQKFMVFRNGIVADTYRKAGAPYRIVFGLQVPQFTEIAKWIRDSFTAEEVRAAARTLWADTGVRESRILSCWLFDAAELSREALIEIASGCNTREEADILSWRLLRRVDDESLAESLEAEGSEGCRMCAEALRR